MCQLATTAGVLLDCLPLVAPCHLLLPCCPPKSQPSDPLLLCAIWTPPHCLIPVQPVFPPFPQVYNFNVPTFGKGVVYDCDQKVSCLRPTDRLAALVCSGLADALQ